MFSKTMKQFPDEKIVEVLRDIKAGKYVKDTSVKFGISQGTIITWAHKAGVTIVKSPIAPRHNWEEIKRLI